MHWLWKAQSYKVHLGKRFCWHYCLQLSFVNKGKETAQGRLKKSFYKSSLGNEVGFREIMRASPNIFAKNKNFKKLRHDFVDERALITTTLTSSCHWKIFVPFCLWNKRPENAFLILIVNYRKILPTKKYAIQKKRE